MHLGAAGQQKVQMIIVPAPMQNHVLVGKSTTRQCGHRRASRSGSSSRKIGRVARSK